MTEQKSYTADQMLDVCRRTPGWLRAEECVWLFETASRIRPGGCWVEVGIGPRQAFLAAGMGLPPETRLACIVHLPGGAQHLPNQDQLTAEWSGNVDRLRELRPDLRVEIITTDVDGAVQHFDRGSVDVVFFQACREEAWVVGQLTDWRDRITPAGKLTGHGMGGPEWPGVTVSAARLLPGVSSGAGSIWSWTPPSAFPAAAELPRLSVIVTTTGRPSLAKTLASIRSQRLLDGDEVLLIHDGGTGVESVIAWDQAKLPGQMLVLATGPHADWGAAARTAGQNRAAGTHLLWQDDDDEYLPGAFDVIRREILATPEDILLFRMAYPSGRLLWRLPIVQVKNVSTQMYVIPRTARLGEWGSHYQGDYEFIQTTIAVNPGRPVRFVDKPTVMYSRQV